MEAVEVIDKDRALAHPLAVELAPEALSPPRIGNGEMKSVGLTAVPVFGREEVAQSIGVLVLHHLGISRGSGREEHQSRLIAARSLRSASEGALEHRIFLVEIPPAFTRAVDYHLELERRTVRLDLVHDLGAVAVSGTDDCLDTRCIEAVLEIMLAKLISCRDCHGADLVQCNHCRPELPVALEDQHDLVALSYSHGKEVVGHSGAFLLHVHECEAALGLLGIKMDHGKLLGIFLGDCIDHIEAEVELLVILEFHIHQSAFGGLLAVGKSVGKKLSGRRYRHAGHQVGAGIGCLILSGKDDCHEQTVLAVDGYHSVRRG